MKKFYAFECDLSSLFSFSKFHELFLLYIDTIFFFFSSFLISLFFFLPTNLLASLQIADSFSMQKEDVSKCHKAEGWQIDLILCFSEKY